MPAIAVPPDPYAIAKGSARRKNEKGLLNGNALTGATGLHIVAVKAARATAPLKVLPPLMLRAEITDIEKETSNECDRCWIH